MSQVVALLALLLCLAAAGPSEPGFDQRVGARLPLAAAWRAEDGSKVTLGRLLGGKPAVILPVYLRCPSLCPAAFDGLLKALRAVSLEPGRDFAVIAPSFDPSDGPAAARARRDELEKAWRGPRPLGLRVITGDQASIDGLADAIGLRVERQGSGQYAHAPGLVVVTADGRAARYLLGVEFSARDLRLALVEASRGRLGRWTDQVLLLCQRYDEAAFSHSRAVLRVMRGLGAATVLALVAALAALSRAEAAG